MSGEYLERMSNEELLKAFQREKKHLAEMNQEYNSNPRRWVMGGDEPSLFNELRFITAKTVGEIEREFKRRGVKVPAER